MTEVGIVTAITRKRGLGPGGNGRIQWYMPEDLDRFQQITTPHPIVMTAGMFRAAVEAIGEPFPERVNIVIAPTEPLPKGCLATKDLQDGLRQAQQLDSQEVFVMGDAGFYTQALPYVTRLYLTIVEGDYQTEETFPPYGDFNLTHSERGSSGGYNYEFQILQRAQEGG